MVLLLELKLLPRASPGILLPVLREPSEPLSRELSDPLSPESLLPVLRELSDLL